MIWAFFPPSLRSRAVRPEEGDSDVIDQDSGRYVAPIWSRTKLFSSFFDWMMSFS